jgi:hypothetical protein
LELVKKFKPLKRWEENKSTGGGYRSQGEPDMVVHTCNPSTWKAEAGGLRVQG